VPNFKVPVEDDGETYDVHFAALFSQKKDATPLLLSHGWPGKSMEKLLSANMPC
jgi:microsomal epoxide hydrolase